MMTRNKVNALLCAILTTAAETEPDTFTETAGYMACGTDMNDWTLLKTLLNTAGLMTFTGSTCHLTEAGRVMAVKVETARLAASGQTFTGWKREGQQATA